MEVKTFENIEGENFSLVNIGDLTDLGAYTFNSPNIPGPFPGKLFLRNEMKLTGMEVSLNKFPAGTEMPFYHKHKENEELYLFIKGKGQFQIDGETVDVCEGTAIRVSPNGVRTWKNTSTEDLFFIIVQAKSDSFGSEEMADSIKVEVPSET